MERRKNRKEKIDCIAALENLFLFVQDVYSVEDEFEVNFD